MATGGMHALLARPTLAGLAAPGEALDRRRLEVRAGYGFGAFGDRFTATPEVGRALEPQHREYRLGWRLALAGDRPSWPWRAPAASTPPLPRRPSTPSASA